uniref:Uncharacterized protein n=1 Tax=Plectus sambesii TaxID=2011161 RepID=A0A914W3N8_9BILA
MRSWAECASVQKSPSPTQFGAIAHPSLARPVRAPAPQSVPAVAPCLLPSKYKCMIQPVVCCCWRTHDDCAFYMTNRFGLIRLSSSFSRRRSASHQFDDTYQSLAFACWSLQVLMLCLVPHYFARTVTAVGVCTWLADIVYYVACPKQLRIRFPGADDQMSVLDFHLGWCFYLTAASGAACVLFGLLVGLLEARSLYKLTTFLQADFDEATSSPARDRDCSDRRQRRPGGMDDLDGLHSADQTDIDFLPLAVMASEAATSGALARRKSTPVLTRTVEPV